MKPHGIVTIILSFILCGQALAQTQDMDKELSDLASKLATLTKDNGKKKVTVLDFTDLQGGSSELGKYIAEQLTVDLVMVKTDFSVLDRANLKKILAEHKLTATGLIDPDNAKKLGQFAGVDALILGNVIPKTGKIGLTAKIITTDTAEIVGAAKAEFRSDETVQQLLAQPSTTEGATDASQTTAAPPSSKMKPFGDLQVKVESLSVLPPSSPGFNTARLTFIITNTSASRTYGVGLETDLYNKYNLSNSRGEEFKGIEVAGINKVSLGYYGSDNTLTEIPPKSAIIIVSKSQLISREKCDYRPFRLQTMVFFGEEENGKYPDIRKYNLLLDIK